MASHSTVLMKCVWGLSLHNLTLKADPSQARAFKSFEHPLVIMHLDTFKTTTVLFDKHKSYGDYEMTWGKQRKKSELNFLVLFTNVLCQLFANIAKKYKLSGYFKQLKLAKICQFYFSKILKNFPFWPG